MDEGWLVKAHTLGSLNTRSVGRVLFTMSTRSDRDKGVAGSPSSMHQRALSLDLWERKPYTIPLTFSIDKFKRNPKRHHKSLMLRIAGPFTDDIMHMHPARLVKALHIVSNQPPYKIPHGEERDDVVASFVTDTCDYPATPMAQEPPPVGGVPRSTTSATIRGGLALYSSRLQ
ncbi:hypothetical protein RHSIM_Rhsim06G0091200 [Rhododendron simsii]|uniref:Uncharacterized protein n=1 Tax=Rhododendron simsii TaxID=118357 RepID=A0A834GU75_RHOSS|nr:hypothetical protein RHSIM_Rhsim06G0091200 [Rhododendron simsii]